MINQNIKILLFQRILPVYRIPVFRQLFLKFGLVVCYSDHSKNSDLSSESGEIDFPVIKISRWYYRKTVTSVVQNPIPVLRKNKPAIVISEGAPSYMTLWVILIIRRIQKFKLVIWSHGINNKELEFPYRSLRGKLQLWLFNQADAVLLYSDSRAEILKVNINNPMKVFVARNTLDTEQLRFIYEKLEAKGKDIIKLELGMIHKFNLIYIGRLYKEKQIEDLILALKKISQDFDVALHIIGDGPEEKALKTIASAVPNVFFYGSMLDPVKTGEMLYSSDLMIMPGCVGLSVVNAFAFGCPVITYKRLRNKGPLHGPEAEYIKDNKNGLFCDSDPEALSLEVMQLLNNPEKISEMSDNAVMTADSEASISEFLSGFRKMLNYLNYSNN